MNTVYVAVYEHKYGTDIRVFANVNLAETWKQGIAAEWWSHEFTDTKPENPEECAETYFEKMGDRSDGEWFSITEAKIEDEPNHELET